MNIHFYCWLEAEMAFTHIDCFSGVGGLCTGLHAAGFVTCVAIESVQSCVDTYSANHPSVHVIHSDIRNVPKDKIISFIPKDGIDLVSSGMPCETFSTAGNTSRSFYDERQFLYREGIRIAKIANAKLLLFENVPAITSKKISRNSSTLIVDVMKKDLAEAGYGNFIEIVLYSHLFGIPQKRNRFFILACKDPSWKLSYPQQQFRKGVTVSEAFAGLPNVIPNTDDDLKDYVKIKADNTRYVDLIRNDIFWNRGKKHCAIVSYQKAMKHRPCTLERFSLLLPGESLKNLFDKYDGEERTELQKRRVLPKKMFIKRNYRLINEEPSPTVTSHCLDEFVHPNYDRALTVRECARLQSFPDSYDFRGGPYIVPHIDRDIQDKYEQIGDAVPPLLAYEWGKEISKILKCNNCW
ncbi:MAG: DNA cytosine methyltransferase [Deltaproteobacteria bacterium]|nr:DNA cytosine methyltransferase [Deltaproteobacteria bacterium]